MDNGINQQRRRFFGSAAAAVAVTQFGLAGSASAQPQAAAAGSSSNAGLAGSGSRFSAAAPSFGTLKQIDAGLLSVGYVEVGPAGGAPVILVHGWPYDIHAFAEVAPALAARGYRVIVPYLRGHGTTRFLSDVTVRNGQQAAISLDILALMDALRIPKAILGGFDWGARAVCVIAALWPERVKGLVSVSGYLVINVNNGGTPLKPSAEHQWWYQYYLATERGVAGYAKYTRDFAKFIWQTASPQWQFDDATLDRSAAAFANPDHVAIVVHNYRWRQAAAAGEARYEELERRLAAGPAITVPSITMEGEANGAPFPQPASYRAKFTGKYEHRDLGNGVGHNLPQEAPQAFVLALLDVAAM
jgi:pimeloyl-ACP methyl ester carboxylesterase